MLRQQDLCTADLGAEVWGSICQAQQEGRGAGTVQGLPEVSHSNCNCTRCIFNVRHCKEKKKKVAFLSCWHPNSFHSRLLESPAQELERDRAVSGALGLCCQHEAVVLMGSTEPARGSAGLAPCSSFFTLHLRRIITCRMQSPLELVQEGLEELHGNGVNCPGSAAHL